MEYKAASEAGQAMGRSVSVPGAISAKPVTATAEQEEPHEFHLVKEF